MEKYPEKQKDEERIFKRPALSATENSSTNGTSLKRIPGNDTPSSGYQPIAHYRAGADPPENSFLHLRPPATGSATHPPRDPPISHRCSDFCDCSIFRSSKLCSSCGGFRCSHAEALTQPCPNTVLTSSSFLSGVAGIGCEGMFGSLDARSSVREHLVADWLQWGVSEQGER